MKRKKEKVPGFDEIIFENRNKEYGAYILRKKYLPAGIWSTIGGAALFTAIVIGAFLGTEKKGTAVDNGIINIVAEFDRSIPDPNKIRTDEPPVPKMNIKQYENIAPKVVDKIDSNDVVITANANLDTLRDRPVDTEIIPEKEQTEVAPVEPEPVVFVSEMPVFPGGESALLRFINDNIKYPTKAVEANIEGKVILRFVVSTDGSVKRIEILRGVDPLLDQEAVRVISLLPKWKPGKNNGNPAQVWFSVPVIFKIQRN